MISIDKILKLENINNYILSLNTNERVVILKNDMVRDYYLEDYNNSKFKKLILNLPNDEILEFIDDEMINKILSNDNCKKIMYEILYNVSSKFTNIIFQNEKMIERIVNDDELHTYIFHLSGNITEKLFNYIIKIDKISVLEYLNPTDFNRLLEREDIKNKIKIIVSDELLKKIPSTALSKLLFDSYFRSKLSKMKMDDIYFKIKKGLILPNFYMYDEDFISKFINITNIPMRRIYIKALMNNNYSLYEIINNRLKETYDNNIFNELINEYNMVTRASDDEELKSKIWLLYSDKCLQLLIDRYFEDFDGNVLTNICTILNFNKTNNVISTNRLKYYNLIMNFDKYDINTMIKIYKIMPKDIGTWLYEDFRKCQNVSYELINKQTVDISKLKKEKVDGISIYELNGEEFVLLVNTLIYRRSEDDIKWGNDRSKTLSLTLIGNESLGTYREQDEYLIVGFKKINVNDIMHVYHSDSFSGHESSTNRVNEIYTPHELLSNTKGYNEILVSQDETKNTLLKPDYVVCYNKVLEEDIESAKKLGNIPIIVINTKCYSMKYSGIEYEENNYVRDIEDLYSYEYKKFK